MRRLLLTVSASATIHAGLLALALLVAGVGAGAVLLVDLIQGIEGDGRLRGDASGPGPEGSERNLPRTRPSSGRSLAPGIAARASPPPRGSSGRADTPELRRKPEAIAETPPPTETAPQAESLPENDARPRPETPTRPEAPASRVGDGPPPPIEAHVQAAADEGARPDRAPAEGAVQPKSGGSSGQPSAGAAGAGASAAGAEGQASNAPGSGGSTVSRAGAGDGRGNVPPEYGPYLQRFRRRVEESLRYPLAARRRGISGRVELEVLLDPSGRVGSARVISSSSHAVLDEAALEAVKDLTPEPLPADLPQRSLRVRLPLGFELE